MPDALINRASCQLENFTIIDHNTHYTKRQLIFHQNQHTNDKIKPNSKSQKTAIYIYIYILIKLKDSASQWANHRFTVQKRGS